MTCPKPVERLISSIGPQMTGSDFADAYRGAIFFIIEIGSTRAGDSLLCAERLVPAIYNAWAHATAAMRIDWHAHMAAANEELFHSAEFVSFAPDQLVAGLEVVGRLYNLQAATGYVKAAVGSVRDAIKRRWGAEHFFVRA